MARFYTNENMPLPVAEALRRFGHDVLTVAESGNAGIALPDSDVLAFATGQKRILVALNRRHFIRLHKESSNHSGIMVCTFDEDFDRQAAAIHEKVTDCPDMNGQLVRINRPSEV